MYYLASNSIPDYNSELVSFEIEEPFEIVRDIYAVPHIKAQNDQDAFFGLGFVHAQDRLWQMHLMRQISQGRLSELLGSTGLESDKLMRSLQLYSLSQQSEKHQSEQTKSLLKAYSNGVNSFINQISKKGLGRGAPEFFFQQPTIAPWRPADSIAVLKLIAFQATDKIHSEILRTQLLLQDIKPERLQDIFDEPPLIADLEEETALLFDPILNRPDKIKSKPISMDPSTIIEWVETPLSAGASNIFAVDAERSATGSSLVAIDPHMMLTAPSTFMLVNMILSTGTVSGGTIPGIPAILIGRSKKIGWGFASAQIDDQDLYIEKINQKNKEEYFTEHGIKKLQKTTEIIKIKDEKPITYDILRTHNGPILSGDIFQLSTIRPNGHAISLSWTGFDNKDRTIEALIHLMKSESIDQAANKFDIITVPGNNILLADNQNIAIYTVGKLPKRNPNHSTKGRMPALGWKEHNSWSGYFPYKINPKTQNPRSGTIINTNNKTIDASFPKHISFDWSDSQRVIRVTNLIRKRQFHTVNSFVEIQTDTVSISARILLPLLAQDLWFNDPPNNSNTSERLKYEILSLLSDWNGDMNQNGAEPLIYATWLHEFQQLLIKDNLGTTRYLLNSARPLFLERVLRNKNGAAEWCDIVQTEAVETCSKIASNALDIAVEKLRREYGETMTRWRWGDAHIAIHKSHLFGNWPLLSFISNIVHEISGGDHTVMMSRANSAGDKPFLVNYGSVMRAIYDFSENENSLFIISTGQSGHILSRHYDDQAELWQKQQYIPMEYSYNSNQGGTLGLTKFNLGEPPN